MMQETNLLAPILDTSVNYEVPNPILQDDLEAGNRERIRSDESPRSLPSKVTRQVSDPVTKEERLHAVVGNSPDSESEQLSAHSQNLLNLLRQDSLVRLMFRGTATAPTFYCQICMENCMEDDSYLISTCPSGHKFCMPCMKTCFTIRIADGVIEQFCPEESCTAKASDHDIELLVAPETYQKYLRFREVKTNPDFRECSQCKTPLTFDEKEKANTMKCCPTCGKKTCFEHGDAHPNESCKQYIRRIRRSEQASTRLLKRIARKCPQCKVETEKNGGCNHMYCQHCHADWCWLCGRSFVSAYDHYDATNLSGCPNAQFAPAPTFALWSILDNCGCHGCLNNCCVRMLMQIPLYLEFLLYGLVMLIVGFICAIVSLSLTLGMLPLTLTWFLIERKCHCCRCCFENTDIIFFLPGIAFTTLVCCLAAFLLCAIWFPAAFVTLLMFPSLWWELRAEPKKIIVHFCRPVGVIMSYMEKIESYIAS